MQEANIPLIPPLHIPENHDTIHILRELFQEELQGTKFPTNVMKNLCKYNVENERVKECAKVAQEIIDRSLLKTEYIHTIEEDMMHKHQRYFVNELHNSLQRERRLLRRRITLRSIPHKCLMQLNLLSKNDLLPSDMEMSMDFKIKEQSHNCKPCDSVISLAPIPHEESINNRSNNNNSNLPQEVISHEGPNLFSVSPAQVVFFDYKLNTTYKKKIKLQNTSNCSQSFFFEFPKTKFFKAVTGPNSKVTAGLHISIDIIFRTDSYLDVQDFIKISGSLGTRHIKVKLASYRVAPNLYAYVFTNNFQLGQMETVTNTKTFDVSRSLALNCCIDCGSCFISQRIQIGMIVQNRGGYGKFFFVGEEHLVSLNLDTIYDSLELEINNIIIRPAYFELDKNEFIVIYIEFFACETGLNLEKINLMCNNVTYEKLHIIGDGITYDQYSVEFALDQLLPATQLDNILYPYREVSHSLIEMTCEDFQYLHANYEEISKSDVKISEEPFVIQDAPPNTPTGTVVDYLNEVPQNFLEEQEEVEKILKTYILNFGVCVPHRSSTKTIQIYNNCLVSLLYSWDVEVDFDILHPDLNILEKSCIELKAKHRVMTPHKATEFEITLTPNVIEEGFYYLTLIFFIKDIPIAAIEEPAKYFIFSQENEDNKGFVDIEETRIQVICKISAVSIEIFPNVINVDKNLLYDEVYETDFHVTIFNQHNHSINYNCCWVIDNSDMISIEPKNITVKENEETTFTLKITNKSYESLSETVKIKVNNTYTKDYVINIPVCSPQLVFSYNYVNFGWLEAGNVYSKKITIINNNHIALHWEIYEILDNLDNQCYGQNVELKVTHLENNNIELEYIVFAKHEIKWVSFLNLYSTYNGKRQLSDKCEVLFKVGKLDVQLHTAFSTNPILCPDSVLFKNTKSKFLICLHNFGFIQTNFTFGPALGLTKEEAQISIQPNNGKLATNSVVHVDLEITSFITGTINDVFIPCYFENCNINLKGNYVPPETMFVMLLCIVEDTKVLIKLPGYPRDIIWPPNLDEVEDEKLPETENSDINEELVKQSQNRSTDLFPYRDISQYLETIMKDSIEDETSQTVPNNSEQSTDDTAASDSDLGSIYSLKYYFDEDFVSQEYTLQISRVPMKQANKIPITIKNINPLKANVSADIVNFPPLTRKKKKVEKILREINGVKSDIDEWEAIVSDNGILIKMDTQLKELQPNESYTIDLWIYANTWGIYADELVIQIDNHVPFCVTLLIEVVGLPIEFPISMNSDQKFKFFRFGNIPYKSKVVRRTIYVKNVSCIPLGIIWHIQDIKSKDKPNQHSLYKIQDKNFEKYLNQDSVGALKVMRGNIFGKLESKVFKLLPKESLIEPNKTIALEVQFNSHLFSAKLALTHIEAFLVGYIHLADNFKQHRHLYQRKTGTEIEPLTLKLQVTLELPKLVLDVLSSSLKFSLLATKVFAQSEVTLTRVLLFKNPWNSAATVTLEADRPLNIDRAQTSQIETRIKHEDIIVPPGQGLEVEISYTSCPDALMTVAESLYYDRDPCYLNKIDYNNYVYKIKPYLRIKQKGFVKQIIPMEISIFYPKIKTVNEIDFGVIYIGNNKKQILTIKNLSTHRVPYYLTSDSEIIMNPSKGMLPSATPTSCSFVDVHLICIPQVVGVFEERILLKTNIPYYCHTIMAKGVAVNDEKYRRDNHC